MIATLPISGFRSLRDLVLPLGQLSRRNRLAAAHRGAEIARGFTSRSRLEKEAFPVRLSPGAGRGLLDSASTARRVQRPQA
jgi:hypothetical protein